MRATDRRVVDQLNYFASGERQNAMISLVAASLSEGDKKAVAEQMAGLQ